MNLSEENNQAGKGDMPRPIALSKHLKNYDLIFNKADNPKEAIVLNNPQMPIIMDPEGEPKIEP